MNMFAKSCRKRTRRLLASAISTFIGPREGHKGSMASVAFHLNTQLNNGESPKLFEGSENFKRDFVYVGDVADVNLLVTWKMAFPASSTSAPVVRNPSRL